LSETYNPMPHIDRDCFGFSETGHLVL
jgi:hypothetical protein